MSKVTFHCSSCDTSFEIKSQFLVKRDSVVCPSCNNQLPENTFSDLKAGLLAIDNADKENARQGISVEKPTHMSFKIQFE